MKTYYVDKIRENAEKYPNRIAVTLDFDEEQVTYSDLWEQSGRIYAALKNSNIGREDIVMLLLPRHPMMITALLGVLRLGAALVLVEDSYPKERIEYIKKDCKVKFVIDRSFFERAMEYPALQGREPLHLNDACFIFYTSGTTGKPKGILHEYGKLDIGIEGSISDEDAVNFDECGRFAFVPPFYFSAVMIHGLPELFKANTLYILSYEISKNYKKLHELLEKEKITELFLSPSVLRSYKEGFSHVRRIMTGSEPASHLYVEGYDVVVHYAMTESLYCVSQYVLKELCENAPIATAKTGKNILILGEDDIPVQEGVTGEICFPDPYFRGYINMPERTREVFRDGLFHSGDLGYRNEKGEIFIKGRIDDMIKINGNRIEPGEIEGAAREISGLKNVIAKGFSDNRRSYVALYYLTEEADENCIFRDAVLSRKKLMEKLPSYMIPTYYVSLSSFPLNANGKLSRKMLPMPDASEFRSNYVKPENETETVFCRIMAETLGLEKVGTDEDFFLIGGDSLTAIRMITACAEEGYFITVNALHECRTAKMLAERFGESKRKSTEELLLENEKALMGSAELSAGQLFQLEMAVNQKAPDIITYHVAMIFGLRPEVNLNKLKEAAEKVILVHPAFLSEFRRDEKGCVRQYYDKSLFESVNIIHMTDEEFAEKKDNLTEAMDPFGGRLYRCRIIVTPSRNYFFFDFHHLIADEMSSSVFVSEVAECYFDEDAVLPTDFLYLELGEKKASRKEESAKKVHEYIEAIREKEEFYKKGILKPDLQGKETGTGIFYVPDAFCRSEKDSNRMFLTACVMAVADMNGEDCAMIYSNYHGRDDSLKKNSVNCYVTPVPILLNCRDGRNPEEMMNDVKEQFEFGTAHCDYPSILDNKELLVNTVMFNYRNGTMNIGLFAKLCNEVYLCPKTKNQPNCLIIAGIVGQPGSDRLGFYCTYPEGVYSENAIQKFYGCYVKAIEKLKERVEK